MIKLIRFQTEEDVHDGQLVYVNPEQVTSIVSNGDDRTTIYTTNSMDLIEVWGNVKDVCDRLDGTAERNRDSYG